MQYLHDHCDGCGQPFSKDDDIVVCPVCATPQHRACYEKEGRCVNEVKHESGFLWQSHDAPAAPARTDDALVPCPVCGFQNRRDARLCIQCGAALAPAQPPVQTPVFERRDVFFDVPDSDALELEEDQREQLEAILAQRAALAAPGMTAEQEQEQIAGHPIKQVLTFIGNNALRYLNKFRRIESGKKLGWNWAAFFLTPYWYFYRKMYRPGVIFLTLRLCLTLLLVPYESRALDFYQSFAANAANLDDAALEAAFQQLLQAMAPIYLGIGALLVMAVVSALLADRLYYRYIKRSITVAKGAEGRDAFLLQFFRRSSVSPLLAVLSYAAVSLIPSIIISFFS